MAETNKQRRARIKRELLERRGGKCKGCGYSKSASALCFHHRDPSTKGFNISGVRLTTISRQLLEIEADKCDVYCLNYHSDLHDVEGWVHEQGKRTPKQAEQFATADGGRDAGSSRHHGYQRGRRC